MAENNREQRAELVITRVFDAPRDVVFAAWTEADRLAEWWGPKGFTWVSGTIDLRPGGYFHYCMKSPAGDEMWGRFEYDEIDPPERLVFRNGFSNEAGEIVRAPFSPDFPLQFRNVLTFEANGDETTLVMRGTPYEATDAEREMFVKMIPSMQAGFAGTLGQLDEYLAKR
jgi:uncharacterized protein YndB with AHSA1/START domain